jgi:hypothetical protein
MAGRQLSPGIRVQTGAESFQKGPVLSDGFAEEYYGPMLLSILLATFTPLNPLTYLAIPR